MTRIEISVVVPSHDRPDRLRTLLDALAEQTLAPANWEVIVAHDSSGAETDELLRNHPLAEAGRLRWLRLPAGSAPPGANRNAGWRAAHGPLVAFTDDDCRPPSGWLEQVLAAARAHPGAMVQGTTRPDPHEIRLMASRYFRTQNIDPPHFAAQACNIAYPRELLKRLDGFHDALRSGEDMDLALRARSEGAPLLGAPEALTYHAVERYSLWALISFSRRWEDLVYVLRQHPETRRYLTYGLFWKPQHARLLMAIFGLLFGRRVPARRALLFSWMALEISINGRSGERGARAVTRVPGDLVLSLVELYALARGSLRYRTLML